MLYVNQNKLEHMLKLTTHSDVVATILKVVSTELFDVVRNDDLGYTSIMAKGGGVRPALCVHTDTVGNTHPETILKDGDIWRNGNTKKLLGADDRAGCYIIKELLTRNVTAYHYLIFDLEEVGGIGSSNYAKQEIGYTNTQRTSCFIGLDRMGAMEMALYGAETLEFLDAIELDGWRFTDGSFTDASNLAYGLDRCCINMSVGYSNEHTCHESLNLSYLGLTMNQLANGLPEGVYDRIHYMPDNMDYDKGYEVASEHDYMSLMTGRDEAFPVLGDYHKNSDMLTKGA